MTEHLPAAGRKRQTRVDFVDPPTVQARVSATFVGQHAVASIAQLTVAGLSRQALAARVRADALFRIHHGVYSLIPRELMSPCGHRMAAVLACGPLAALSHHSAGAYHGLITSSRTRIDVTVPTRGGRRRDGIQIHRSTTLRPADVELVNAVPTTTVARTLFDLAEVLSTRRLERALDQADAERALDLTALQEQIDHNRGRLKPAGALTRMLDDHLPGSTPTWNEIEERMLAIVRQAGLPDPEVQVWLDLHDGEPMIRPDFIWRASKLIVETDGFQHHGTRHGFESDRRRDQRAIVAGWRPVRTTWRQITTEPGRLAATLTALAPKRAPASRSTPLEAAA